MVNYLRTTDDVVYLAESTQLHENDAASTTSNIVFVSQAVGLQSLLDQADEAVFIWKDELENVKEGIRYCIMHQIPYRIFGT